MQGSYLAYLLRLWRSDSAGTPVWRASLESPHSGERLVFADVGALCAFLQQEVGRPVGPGAGELQAGGAGALAGSQEG